MLFAQTRTRLRKWGNEFLLDVLIQTDHLIPSRPNVIYKKKKNKKKKETSVHQVNFAFLEGHIIVKESEKIGKNLDFVRKLKKKKKKTLKNMWVNMTPIVVDTLLMVEGKMANVLDCILKVSKFKLK